MTTTPSRLASKGQVATVDFIIGFVIMTSALVIAANLVVTMNHDDGFERLRKESQAIADTLLSEGYPTGWNQTTVIKAGLLTQNRLNTTKQQMLDNYTYSELKQVLGAGAEVYWYYQNASDIVIINACGHGSPNVSVQADCTPTINADNNLLRTDRLVAYQGRIISMVIMTWD